MLVDAWNGDARLRVGSPCIVDGVQVCGAYIGEPVEGVSVSAGVQGAGAVSNETILVTNGGNATIEAVETARPFLYWIINGEQVEGRIYTLTNVTADVRAIAVFASFDWYVDAEYGDDANDGSDWDAAKRTLQAAVDAAVDDEVIYVEAGTYAPISTDNKRIRIESVNGAEMTFIDGSGTSRCATLGAIYAHTNSALIGFTLMNGRAPQSGSYSSYGGGAYFGTLECCIISNCVANGYYAYGGGAYYGNLNNCLVAYNCATSSSYRAYGGGTYGSTLRSCTIARNSAVGSNAAYGGGTHGNSYSAYNTIIWGNEVRASNTSNAYYPDSYYQNLYYCCTSSSSDRRYSGTITNDPQFVDTDAGNFHLKVGSACLNVGCNSYVQGDMDLDWDDRIQGAAVDMGCYEGAEYAAPPGQVTGLRAVRGVITWDAMPDAEGFMVYRSTRRAPASAKYIGMADTNMYTDETAVDGTTYYYWVTAFNTLGMGTRSDVKENTWPEPLAIATTELPNGRVHDEYSVQLQAIGGGLPYSWEAVTPGYAVSSNASTFAETGTAKGWHADDSYWSLALPFDFPFYGQSYRTAYISSNGTISFGQGVSQTSYSANTSTFYNNAIIAALWKDLRTDGTCDIFVASDETCVTIRWSAVYYSGGTEANFSVTLHADGRIVLSYGGGNANGGMCGISAGDGRRYHIVRNDSSSWSNAKDIVFVNGGYEVNPNALPNGFTLSSEGVISGIPAENGMFTAYIRVTDAIGDSVIAEFPFVIEKNPITFYVDAANGNDANDGLSVASAKRSIQSAINVAFDDDVILVSDGVYTPIYSPNRRLRIESMNGVGATFIDGGGTNRCATLSDRYYNSASLATNTVLAGFTLVNGMTTGSYVAYGGGTYYGTLEHCVISNCVALATEGNNGYDLAYGGAAYFGVLENCLITDNHAESPYYSCGGGTYCSILRNCTVVGNTAFGGTTTYGNGAGYGGGSYSGVAYNSIVWGNETDSASSDVSGVATYNSLISVDPKFKDSANGDFRLAVGSPCLDAGDNAYVRGDEDLNGNVRIIGSAVDLGCYEGAVYNALPGIVMDVNAVRGVVTWMADLMSQEYEILRGATDDVSSAVVVATVYDAEWTDEDADSGHLYWYWVRGKNPLGTGALGNAAQMSWPGPLAIATENLPAAMEMVEYSAQLEATGGVAPYSWCSPAGGYSVTTNSTSTFAKVGTAQGWTSDDESWEYALPFAFQFYGQTYRNVYVNDNGTLSFGHGVSYYSYNNNTFTNTPMVAAMWADLIASPGDVYISTSPSSVTFRWARRYWDSTLECNFSITLYSDGDIKLAYGSGNVNGGFVGVSAGDGENFVIIDDTYYPLNNAADMALKPSGLPRGLSISDDGAIIGTPTVAGTNTFIVTVTDAIGDTVEKELSIVVNENSNHKPVIDAVSPTTNVYVKVGNSATFAVTAHDPEGATLEYAWYLDGDEIECSAHRYTFAATLDDAGAHTLECVVSDGLWTDMVRHKWSFRVTRDWYVNVAAAEDPGDGSSADSAIGSMGEALGYAEDGDTIYVAPGTYEDYLELYYDRTVSIIATGGAQSTFFAGSTYGMEWWPGEDVAQSSMSGFTICGSYIDGVTLHDCVLTSDETGCYPSQAYGCRLFDCAVTGNICDYELILCCELTRCTVAGNTVGDYGVIASSSCVYDSIVWGNISATGETSNYNTELMLGYDEYDNEVEYADVNFENSCTWPMPFNGADAGVITVDPRLVDAVNGDLRLRVGSPCIVNGVQTMGVCLGEPVSGFVLSVRIEGHGAVSPMTAVVANGGNATFEVTDNTRPFLGFSTNGVFATAADTLTWQGVRSDGIVTAAFSNFTFFVDAATGDDANDGLSWATAKASIQSAIDNAVRSETIYVKAGTYDPISVGAGMQLRIEGVDGKENTVIDGGGKRQCANLGVNGSFCSTLIGFTLTNGYSSRYGGGATGGMLIDCDVIGNMTAYRGGGLNGSTAIRCRIIGNEIVSTSGGYYGIPYGGGAYGGALINCLVAYNAVYGQSFASGGGTCQTWLFNCTIFGNTAEAYDSTGGGATLDNAGMYNTIVYGNYAVRSGYEDLYSDGSSRGVFNSLVGEDPWFADETNDDFRLTAGSPCIDAGNNTYVKDDVDLDGNERIQHYTVDIGCYEYPLATPERDSDADFAAQMAGTCHGVFVGVNEYLDPSDNLIGCVLDATNMQARCVENGYWHGSNTVALLNSAATKSAVRARMAALAAKAVSGDTVLYYQSSHGLNHSSYYGYTRDTAICLHDAEYEDYEMAEDLLRFAAGVKVVIVLDACHSAGMFKAKGSAQSSAVATSIAFAQRVRELMAERTSMRKGAKSGITADDIGWIAAADYNQYSYDSPRGGDFTVAMIDGWRSGVADYDGDKRLNFHELWRYGRENATGTYWEPSDAQCLNEDVLLSRFAGVPDSSGDSEATETTPVPVDHGWLDSYPDVLAMFGGDYEAMASAPSPGASGSGKTWSDGSPCYVWQDFVAGTSPTNDTVFTATIRMEGNTPVVTWEPDTLELRATRVYRTFGKKTLLDVNWTDITGKDKSEYYFFKVTVDMP